MPGKHDPEFIIRCADMFSAMGTEPRLRIMQLLLSAHPAGMVVGEIGSELDIPSSTLSQHFFGADYFVAGTAFAEEKRQQLAQRFGVRGVPQEGAVAPDLHQAFVLQLVEMMREGGAGNVQFAADLADHHAGRVSGEEQLHDAKLFHLPLDNPSIVP